LRVLGQGCAWSDHGFEAAALQVYVSHENSHSFVCPDLTFFGRKRPLPQTQEYADALLQLATSAASTVRLSTAMLLPSPLCSINVSLIA